MISSAITLVRLRWTLTLATLRKSAWQTVAYVFSAVLAAGTIIGTGVLAWFIGILPPFTVNADGFPLNILGSGGIVNIVVVLVGATMTIFIGFIQLMMLGEGSTMNPRKFALYGIADRNLQFGLLLSGLSGIPALTGVASLMLWTLAYRHMGPAVIISSLLAAVLAVITMMSISKLLIALFTTLVTSKRGKGAFYIFIVLTFVIICQLPNILVNSGVAFSLNTETWGAATTIVAWTPFGAAFQLPFDALTGAWAVLLARIAMQAEVDVIVLGGMGLKYDDYLFFRDTLEKSGAMGRTVMFVHTASDPTVECTLVPDLSLAVAEQFALAGKRVLVLLTDMTNFADAQKEMAITMEQVPSNRGYPGDLYSCLASRYEKAVDFEGAGSITILGVTTMPGDDVTHPVPDNTGYITEGQYYLKNGHIEPFGSLSRLKQNVNGTTRSDHRALMDGMIRLYSAYKESLEKKSMGFMMSEWDEKLLKYGHLFETKLMDLSVNIPLEEALDLGWGILAECFEPNETGLKTSLLQERWPKKDALN